MTFSMNVRSISVTLTPASRFLPSRRTKFHVVIDEKPLGRRMKPAWQKCVILKGYADLKDISNVAEMVETSLRENLGALAEDVGLAVTTEDRGRFTSRVAQRHAEKLRHNLAKMIDNQLFAD